MAKKKDPREGQQGRIAIKMGTDEVIMCPECETYPVVYNGNYFCDGHGWYCAWALAHPARTKRDRAFCDAVGTDYY